MPKKMKKAKASSRKKAKKMKKVMRRPAKKARPAKRGARSRVKNLKKAKAKKAVKKVTKAKARKVAKKPLVKKAQVRAVAEKVIGRVTHYYDRIGVAVVAVDAPIRIGDTVRLKHGKNVFDQKVESMQFNHTPIPMANAGDEVGMKVDQVATEGTLLLKP